MSKRYVVIMKKDKGFENINESIIRKLESDGWKVERNYQLDFMLATTNKIQHLYRKSEDLVKKFKRTLSPMELTRIRLVELSGDSVEEAVNNPRLFVND